MKCRRARRMCWYVKAEVDACGDELARLRGNGPRTPVAAAVLGTAVVIGYGNAVVWAGRRYGQSEWLTLTAVPALGIVGTAALRMRGWSLADVGVARPVLPDRRLARFVLLLSGTLLASMAGWAVLRGDATRRLGVVRLVLGTALGEELIHRGVVLTLWNSAPVSRRVVLPVNMVAFGLWHVAGATKPSGFRPQDVVVPAVGAAVFVWARLRFRSLAGPATLHGGTNIWGA